jgi:hypothetical protein
LEQFIYYFLRSLFWQKVTAIELRSRVHSQLRNKSIADESQQRLRLAESNRSATQQVVTAVNEERRTLRVGGLVTAAVLVVAALAFLFSYRRTQEQNTRVYAAITRLQAGVLTQEQLMERSRRALQDRDQGHLRRVIRKNSNCKRRVQTSNRRLRSTRQKTLMRCRLN